jgi:hypothetical protein
MAATTTDLHPTDASETDAVPAAVAAPLPAGLSTTSTLMAVLTVFIPLFGMIGAALVARRARAIGSSTRFPDLVMFWAGVLFYFETLYVFWLGLGLLGHH